jgi:hypothetical protein
MNLAPNLSLVGSLLVLGGCGGFLHASNAETSLSAPGPTRTVQLPPQAPAADGSSYYARLSYSYDRGSLRGSVPVAVQLECPAGQSITGSCGVSRRFEDGSRDDSSYSVFQSLCYDPSTSAERGYEACRVGALFCGTLLHRAYDAEGENAATPEATGATFTFSARCAPTPSSRP